MKKYLLILLLIVLVPINGCIQQETMLSDEEMETLLVEKLLEAYPHMRNLEILQIDQFQDQKVALYSYEYFYDSAIHVFYRFFDVQSDTVELKGGGGGRKPQPHETDLAVSFGSAIYNQNQYYSIIYGIVYNESITNLRITLTDGETIMAEVMNQGILILREGEIENNEPVPNLRLVEGLDENLERVYRIPEEE